MPEATISSPSNGAFDSHHPPSKKIIETCVHCGFCLPVCPTYVLWHEEMDSPRGRIQLIKLASEGKATLNPTWVEHFDRCLGCMACMTACPSGVDYGKLLEATRAQIERQHKRPTLERWYREFIFSLFAQPSRLRLLRLPLLIYQKLGLQSLVRSSGLLKWMPRQLQTLEALMPPAQPREIVRSLSDESGLLIECV